MKDIYKILIVFIAVLFFVPTSAVAQGKTRNSLRYVVIVDTYPFKNAKSATLSKEEIVEVENLIAIAVNKYNTGTGDKITKIKGYYKQFVSVINANGEKEVWVNCFCHVDNDSWKEHIMVVMDGGSCYFNLKINLANKSYYDLMVNGNA